MSLSCSCDYEWEPEPGDWNYWDTSNDPLDFEELKTAKRKRCCACNELIDIGALCLKHTRYRYPYTDIEADIIGFDWNGEPPIRIADHYHCEKCGEIYLNLTAIGYECILPSENMNELLKEYQEISGFKHQYNIANQQLQQASC